MAILNFFFAAASTERGAGNNPEPFGVAFGQLGPTFINVYIVKLLQTLLIKTEGNIRVMICLGQGGLCSPNVSSRTGRRLMFYKTSLVIICY